jgi:hypothetical protein
VVIVKHGLGPLTCTARYCSRTSNLPYDLCLGGRSTGCCSASGNCTRLATQNRIGHQPSKSRKNECRKGTSLTQTTTSGIELRTDGAGVLTKRIPVLQHNAIRGHSGSPRFDSGIPTGRSALPGPKTRREIRNDIPIPTQANRTPSVLVAPILPSSN